MIETFRNGIKCEIFQAKAQRVARFYNGFSCLAFVTQPSKITIGDGEVKKFVRSAPSANCSSSLYFNVEFARLHAEALNQMVVIFEQWSKDTGSEVE